MAKAVTLKDKDDNELYPVTSFDLVCGKSFFWKKTPGVSSMSISTAWTNTAIPNWGFTFTADVGAIYKVEIYSTYVAWNGSSATEVDMRFNVTNATFIAYGFGVATGTYGGGTSFPRAVSGIIQASSSSVTITPTLTAGATGNLARVDDGYIFVMKIG